MAPKSEQREQALGRICAHMLGTGLSETSLRQLAGAADISDRMLLYYFKNKNEVLTTAMQRIAMQLLIQIGGSVPADETYSVSEFLTLAADMTRSPEMVPFMRLFIESIAAAARKEAPFDTISGQLIEGFLGWIEGRLSDDTPDKRAAAAMILAFIDGLALLDIASDRTTSDAAVSMLTGVEF